MRPRGRPLLVVLAASLLLHLSLLLLLLLLALPAAVVVAAPAASRATAPPPPTPRPASKPLPASSSLLTSSDVRPAPCEPGACKQGRCGFRDCPAGTTVTCRGGGCLFENVADATCDGGGCRFVGCGRGDCRGGGCDFTAHSPDHALDDAFCDGGGCTIDGYAARSNARSFKACEWTRRKGEGEGERGRGGGEGRDVCAPFLTAAHPPTRPRLPCTLQSDLLSTRRPPATPLGAQRHTPGGPLHPREAHRVCLAPPPAHTHAHASFLLPLRRMGSGEGGAGGCSGPGPAPNKRTQGEPVWEEGRDGREREHHTSSLPFIRCFAAAPHLLRLHSPRPRPYSRCAR
jgi:hypothetical protein